MLCSQQDNALVNELTSQLKKCTINSQSGHSTSKSSKPIHKDRSHLNATHSVSSRKGKSKFYKNNLRKNNRPEGKFHHTNSHSSSSQDEHYYTQGLRYGELKEQQFALPGPEEVDCKEGVMMMESNWEENWEVEENLERS